MIGCHHAQTHHDSQLTLTKIPEPQPARRDDRIDGGRRVGRLAVGDYLVGPRVEGAVASAEAGARLLIEACVVSLSLVCKTQASGCKTLASDEQGGVLPQNCVCAGKEPLKTRRRLAFDAAKTCVTGRLAPTSTGAAAWLRIPISSR